MIFFGSETISIALGKSYVAFSGSEVRLVCRHLKSESGLDLDKILPANPKEQYTIDRQQYLSALNYLAECARGTERPCVRYERGLLELSGDHCYYAARIDTTGENELPYMFNLRYMQEALKQFAGMETLTVSTFGASNSPILLTAGTETAMVLPVRISERRARRDRAA